MNSLIALGIPERTAQVYVLLTRKGEVVARDVVEAFSLTRATAHDALVDLERCGFARSTRRGKERIFTMESPHVIHERLEADRLRTENRAQAFAQMMPSLNAFHAGADRDACVRYVKGECAVRDLRRELMVLPGDVTEVLDDQAFADLEDLRSGCIGEQYFAFWQKNIRSIVLTNRHTLHTSRSGHDVRIFPRHDVSIFGQFYVCADRVCMVSSGKAGEEITAIEIRSQIMANMCRLALELAWQKAEDYHNIVAVGEG